MEHTTATPVGMSRFSDVQPSRLQLPHWAKHDNPIVRRHLGMYWKTIPPDVQPIFTIYIAQVIMIFLTIPMPVIFDLTMPLVVASVVIMPFLYVFYGRILLSIAVASADVMSQELRNDTLNLLRTTPIPLHYIFLGKVASAVWRHVDDLALLLFATVAFSLPLVVMNYANTWSPTDFPYTSHFAISVAVGASLVRLVLEPIMIGAVGILIGSTVRYKSTAMTATMVVGFFYFVFINMLRYTPVNDNLALYMFIDLLVPVAMPIIITVIILKISALIVERD